MGVEDEPQALSHNNVWVVPSGRTARGCVKGIALADDQAAANQWFMVQQRRWSVANFYSRGSIQWFFRWNRLPLLLIEACSDLCCNGGACSALFYGCGVMCSG